MNKLSNTYIVGVSLILLVYLAIGTLYAVNTPAWQAPDEPAHYNYIKHIVEHRSLPILELGDYDQKYITDLIRRGFPHGMSIDLLKYEAHQPPLYYLLATPIFVAFDGSLLALRLFSLILGACVVVLSSMATNLIFSRNLPITLSVSGFVAFVPQHLAMMSSVNNDSMAEVCMVLGLWLIMRRTKPWVIGIVVGFAFLTKVTVYALVVVAIVAAIYRIKEREVRLSSLLQLLVPSLLIGAVWWLRNILVYDWPDLLGLINHSEVVVGQPRTVDWLDKFGVLGLSLRFVQTTFNSFWGQFGWMAVPMKPILLRLLTFLLIVIVIGNYLLLKVRVLNSSVDKLYWLVILSTLSIVILQYLQYNLEFVQHQGRYLFPALLPFALFYVAGLRGWSRYLEKHWPNYSYVWYWIPVVYIPTMAILSVYALYFTIIPAFA
ncbi:MAG: hypothetical protein CL606_06935 [Anaerolineaceae bacterium]|nr:hypothetical protein [Anaerolineaceae bacterium]